MTTMTEESTTPICQICGRKRTPADFDYSPLQVVRGERFGWYSGSDGEICPEDFGKMFAQANAPAPKRGS